MIKTQEELLEELLEEVQETRRYAEAMHQSSVRVIGLVDTLMQEEPLKSASRTLEHGQSSGLRVIDVQRRENRHFDE